MSVSAEPLTHGGPVVSADPADTTPHVLDGRVRGITTVGSTTVVVGTALDASTGVDLNSRAPGPGSSRGGTVTGVEGGEPHPAHGTGSDGVTDVRVVEPTSTVSCATVRGALVVDGQLYTAWSDGTMKRQRFNDPTSGAVPRCRPERVDRLR